MKTKDSGQRSNASFQARIEILCAKWPELVILAEENGYRLLCRDDTGKVQAWSSERSDLAAVVRELTPDV